MTQARRSGDLRRVVALLEGWQHILFDALVHLGGPQKDPVLRQDLVGFRLRSLQHRAGSSTKLPGQAISLAAQRLRVKGLVVYASLGGRSAYALSPAAPYPGQPYTPALPPPPAPAPAVWVWPLPRRQLALPPPPARPVALALPAPAVIPRLPAPQEASERLLLRTVILAYRWLERSYLSRETGQPPPTLTTADFLAIHRGRIRAEEILRTKYPPPPDADQPRRGVRG